MTVRATASRSIVAVTHRFVPVDADGPNSATGGTRLLPGRPPTPTRAGSAVTEA